MSKEKRALIETFPNPYPNHNYEIHIVSKEFTSICPFTGQPDFAQIDVVYTPAEKCIEFKSFKLYLQSYRNRAISQEEATNQILDDIVKACGPCKIEIVLKFNIRGGLQTYVRAYYEQ